MNWQSFFETIGGAAVIVAAMAWLTRTVFQNFLSKDLEKFKNSLRNQAFEFESLHVKRTNLIADLYSHLYELYYSFQQIQLQLYVREIREDVESKSPNQKQPWEIKLGIDFLNENEEKTIKETTEKLRSFERFYGANKIYFPIEICSKIERFTNLVSGIASSYTSVALKDENGEHYVNPKVIEIWNLSVPIIPEIMENLEQEFRNLLGVTKKIPNTYQAPGGQE